MIRTPFITSFRCMAAVIAASHTLLRMTGPEPDGVSSAMKIRSGVSSPVRLNENGRRWSSPPVFSFTVRIGIMNSHDVFLAGTPPFTGTADSVSVSEAGAAVPVAFNCAGAPNRDVADMQQDRPAQKAKM